MFVKFDSQTHIHVQEVTCDTCIESLPHKWAC